MVKEEKGLEEYESKLTDRFGPLPNPAKALLDSLRVKWIATRLGIEKLVMKNGKMVGYFISDQNSEFYQSHRFTKILEFVQRHPEVCRMKEKQTPNGLRLLLTFDHVKSIRKALELISMMDK